jgi:hypothetical protein
MAGSYNHCVTDAGNLMSNDRMMISGAMIENLGDAYEAIEEMFGMIWWLASHVAPAAPASEMKAMVEAARKNYKEGLETSKQIHRDFPDHRSRRD